MNNFRKYDTSSFKDFIRYIRNKINHFHEIPKDIKRVSGNTPEEFIEYVLAYFPKLLSFMHVYSLKKKMKIHIE